ncbi:hypothetical protein JOC70_002983 [Clostridium pascui]|uniref:hypothetical protein n=1 Tax=Clostridium pascui TaxID=46609 RepID=UPI0019595C97|nr:hypothetical protein [Clostridium pascui]MBM7871483.1 hypothetical protein [Clostridium pascui]
MDFFWKAIGIILTVALCLPAIVIYKNDYNLMINNIIIMTKQYKLKVVRHESGDKVIFINGKEKMDYVRAFNQNILRIFVYGEKGYYIISKCTGKMLFYESYELIPPKYKYAFDKVIDN